MTTTENISLTGNQGYSFRARYALPDPGITDPEDPNYWIPVDLTGYEITAHIRRKPRGPLLGEFDVTLDTQTDTGTPDTAGRGWFGIDWNRNHTLFEPVMFWDIRLEPPGGTEPPEWMLEGSRVFWKDAISEDANP